MTDGTALFLTSDDVRGLATIEEYVEAVREGYRERGEGAPARPRTRLTGGDPPGMLTGYTAILPETGAMGGYMYTGGFGSGDAHFVLPLFDADTGAPLAVFDGASLNPFKTGATGAVGIDALARADATDLAVIGSGSQARGQLRAAVTVRDFEAVRVFSPTPENRESFAEAMDADLDPTVDAVDSSTAAVADADVVITATTASEPVFDGEDLPDGAHVTCMGQYDPEKREVDAETVARATYVPDLRERVERDAGAFLLAREAGAIGDDHVHAELGEVVAGVEPGRTHEDEVTLFDSGGTAIETVAAAHVLYQKAVDAGFGRAVEFLPASRAFEE
jgi:alanine dehydrogenase